MSDPIHSMRNSTHYSEISSSKTEKKRKCDDELVSRLGAAKRCKSVDSQTECGKRGNVKMVR